MLEIIEEKIENLEEIGTLELCSTTTTCSSLDVEDIDVEIAAENA
jgi:hypothetical protein